MFLAVDFDVGVMICESVIKEIKEKKSLSAGDKVNIFVEGFTRGLHKTSNQFSIRSQCLKATA